MNPRDNKTQILKTPPKLLKKSSKIFKKASKIYLFHFSVTLMDTVAVEEKVKNLWPL
jgi:hypothetical protein